MNKITFHSNRYYNSLSEKYYPVPAKTQIPKWFSGSDRYFMNKATGDYFIDYKGDKVLNFKTCPALLDVFTSGYFYVTPCDLTFEKVNGSIIVKTEPGFEDFCGSRPAMPGFNSPEGYGESHFHWYPNFAPSLPKGYSAMYVSPLNRFDLPFITVAGIIDNDDMDTPGLMPFFLKKDFEGVLPAGTPYVQIIPFKRDDWQMEVKHYSYEEILERHDYQAKKFRVKEGGAYKKHVWSRKRYE